MEPSEGGDGLEDFDEDIKISIPKVDGWDILSYGGKL